MLHFTKGRAVARTGPTVWGVFMGSANGFSRREFVGAVGGAAAFMAAPGVRAAGPGPNEKVRIALIGAGSRGNQLLDTFLPQKDVEIVGVYDVDDKHASETCERVKTHS